MITYSIYVTILAIIFIIAFFVTRNNHNNTKRTLKIVKQNNISANNMLHNRSLKVAALKDTIVQLESTIKCKEEPNLVDLHFLTKDKLLVRNVKGKAVFNTNGTFKLMDFTVRKKNRKTNKFEDIPVYPLLNKFTE